MYNKRQKSNKKRLLALTAQKYTSIKLYTIAFSLQKWASVKVKNYVILYQCGRF